MKDEREKNTCLSFYSLSAVLSKVTTVAENKEPFFPFVMLERLLLLLLYLQ